MAQRKTVNNMGYQPGINPDIVHSPEVSPMISSDDFGREDINNSLRRAMNNPDSITFEDTVVLGALDREFSGGEI